MRDYDRTSSRVGTRERFGKRRRSGGNNGAGINNTAAKDPGGKKSIEVGLRGYFFSVTTRYIEGGERRMLFPVICSAVVAASFVGGKAIITKSSLYSGGSLRAEGAQTKREAGAI